MDMIMANDPPLPTTVIEEFIMVHLNSNPSVARKVPFDGWSDLELMDRGQFLASLLRSILRRTPFEFDGLLAIERNGGSSCSHSPERRRRKSLIRLRF
jgi:hypothetical protein